MVECHTPADEHLWTGAASEPTATPQLAALWRSTAATVGHYVTLTSIRALFKLRLIYFGASHCRKDKLHKNIIRSWSLSTFFVPTNPDFYQNHQNTSDDLKLKCIAQLINILPRSLAYLYLFKISVSLCSLEEPYFSQNYQTFHSFRVSTGTKQKNIV